MKLSKRLQGVADCVTAGFPVADVGTDHGYLPIYLTDAGIVPKAYAMDINEGPLSRAQEHIREYGLEGKIETRLSDGIRALLPGEAGCAVLAGMGGGLMIHILEADPENIRGIQEWILEPQSEAEALRRYLDGHGFAVIREDMVEEDGKYYPVIKAVKAAGRAKEAAAEADSLMRLAGFRYGALLLEERHPVLHEYLCREKKIKERIMGSLPETDGERIRGRKKELSEELLVLGRALERWNT